MERHPAQKYATIAENAEVKMSKKFIEDGHHGSSCFCCPRAAPPSTIGFANVVSAANLAASNFQAVTFYLENTCVNNVRRNADEIKQMLAAVLAAQKQWSQDHWFY